MKNWNFKTKARNDRPKVTKVNLFIEIIVKTIGWTRNFQIKASVYLETLEMNHRSDKKRLIISNNQNSIIKKVLQMWSLLKLNNVDFHNQNKSNSNQSNVQRCRNLDLNSANKAKLFEMVTVNDLFFSERVASERVLPKSCMQMWPVQIGLGRVEIA